MIISIILAFIAATAVLTILISYFIYRHATLGNQKHGSVWENDKLFYAESKKHAKYGDDLRERKAWLRRMCLSDSAEKLHITSHDGLTLEARFLKNPDQCGIVLMFHGYRSNPVQDFASVAREIYEAGFSLLFPDQRSHGASEGRYISYGIFEGVDAALWSRLLASMYPSSSQILYGVSMGAATVIAAQDNSLPENVAGIAADCSYTSPSDICKKVLRYDYHLPIFPIYNIAAFFTKKFAGFDFDCISCTDILKKSSLPILIFHGKADSFVPYKMGEALRDAASDRAVFLSVENASHAESSLAEREKYMDNFFKFAKNIGFCR